MKNSGDCCTIRHVGRIKKMSLKIDGEFIMDSQQLADLWGKTLVTPLQDNGIYDQFHKNDIKNSEDITYKTAYLMYH